MQAFSCTVSCISKLALGARTVTRVTIHWLWNRSSELYKAGAFKVRHTVSGGKELLHHPRSGRCLPMYPFKSFMVLALTLRSLIVSELIFMYGGRQRLKFIPLYVDVPLSQHHLLKRLLFPHWIVLAHLLKINCLIMQGFIFGLADLYIHPYGNITPSWSRFFVASCEIVKCESSHFVLFSRLFWLFGAPCIRISLSISAEERWLIFW